MKKGKAEAGLIPRRRVAPTEEIIEQRAPALAALSVFMPLVSKRFVKLALPPPYVEASIVTLMSID